MKTETSVFLTAIVFSFLAFAITLYNVPFGTVELNPIGAFWMSSGLPFVGFVVGWIIIYAVFRILVFSQPDEKLPKHHKFLLVGLLLGVTFMDLLGDLFVLGYIYINIL